MIISYFLVLKKRKYRKNGTNSRVIGRGCQTFPPEQTKGLQAFGTVFGLFVLRRNPSDTFAYANYTKLVLETEYKK